MNLARRHLNSSQCAFVALEVERVLAEEAKERQVEAGKEFGRGQEKLVEKIPQAIAQEADPKSREKAASIIGNTNARYVQDAKKIEREAPEVKELVMANLSATLALPSKLAH